MKYEKYKGKCVKIPGHSTVLAQHMAARLQRPINILAAVGEVKPHLSVWQEASNHPAASFFRVNVSSSMPEWLRPHCRQPAAALL